jgi:hypothetical protein
MRRIGLQRAALLLAGVLVAASCSADTSVTAPSLDAPPDPSLASLHNGGRPIETFFAASLVDVELVSMAELPSGTVIQEAVLTWEASGDWVGTFVVPVRQVFHRNGVTNGTAFFTFDGTVLGFQGTVEMRHAGTFRPDGTFKGNNAILRGTGELANLRGQGKNIVVEPGVIEGTILVRFAP